jgi:hypothetical protein
MTLHPENAINLMENYYWLAPCVLIAKHAIFVKQNPYFFPFLTPSQVLCSKQLVLSYSKGAYHRNSPRLSRDKA